MVDLDSDLANDEQRAVAVNLRKTTSTLVRHFHQNEDAFLKLQTQNDTRSSEFAGFQDFFQQMKDLYTILLTTAKEEQDSMNKQIQILQDSTKNLTTTKDNRQETLQKQLESMKEQKEMREMEIANLRSQIHSEVSNKNLKQKNIDENTEELKKLEDEHAKKKKDRLTKEI